MDEGLFSNPKAKQEDLAREYYSEEEIARYRAEQARDVSLRNQARGRELAGGEAAPSTNWEGVDVSTGAPAWDRFIAGFKSGPEGRLNFYKKRFGESRVRTSPGGELEFYNEPTRKWTRVDEEGMSFKDLADFGGDLPELLGMMAAPALRATKTFANLLKASEGSRAQSRALRAATTAGGGAAAGNVARQAAGQATPGGEDVSFSDPLKAAVGAEAVGLYSKFSPSLNVARAVAGRPTELSGVGSWMESYLHRRLAQAGSSEVAMEGLRLSKQTGIPLNLAEITGDPWLKVLLGFAHRSGFGQELALKEAGEKQSAALAMFGRMMERLGGPEAFKNPNYTEAALGAAKSSLGNIQERLKKVNYGFLDRPEGGMPTIPLIERNRYLRDRVAYYRSMGEPGAPIAKELERLMQGTEQGAHGEVMANPRLMQQYLQDAGERGFGSLPEKEFPRLSAMAGTKESRDLWAATKQDLENAATANPTARALLEARTSTGELLAQREALEKTPLLAFLNSKGMLGDVMEGGKVPAADTVIPHLLNGMTSGKISPGEMGNMTNLMQHTSPEFVDKLAQASLAKAIVAGIKGKEFDYAAAVKALPDMHYLQALYKDVWDPGQKASGIQVASDLKLLFRTIERISKFGLGIPQPPQTAALRMGEQVFKGDFQRVFMSALSKIILPRTLARVSFDPSVRESLLAGLQGGVGAAAQKSFLQRFGEQVVPALVYEGGSSVQQRNQAGFGGSQ